MGTTKSSVSSRRGSQPAKNGATTTPQEVRVPAGSPLSEDHRREIAELARRADQDIDLTDMPEWTAEMFASAVRGKFYRPVKSQLTVRLDSDVLAWLKAKGRGYQTRINAILRQAMVEDVAPK
jgi:uncharacterized protein (DUF4415 family)